MTDFLYPFLGGSERGLEATLEHVAASTLDKGNDVAELRRGIDLEAVTACGLAIRDRLHRGGRLLAFGNGGSSTDAQDAAGDFLAAGWGAIALTNDAATITGVANDVGYDNVFSRQLIALARADDVALAFSTSGSSRNVVAGLEEAHRRLLLTCAVTGYGGGTLRELPWLDHLFVAAGDYIPRLQEAHATVVHLLLEVVGERS
ncbi:Phosphoheptose isomerase [Gaiella occulta]|uniref:Phosphoheptose isomerase n=1 Tax=Gaiella occulta TaxID=1002870 RepID=A0A7M2Z150_9ACTN|nr:SIS domain-containing protein [Gaiella occulta]RDI75849.1 Phosphoheptose isomerase [Gaiella occulta]